MSWALVTWLIIRMSRLTAWVFVLGVLLARVMADPITVALSMQALHGLSDWSPLLQPRAESRLPLAAAAELSSRLAAHSQHVQNIQDPRLPIPTPQDIEAIKKVAQILITLGQQVIPAIVGEPTAQTTMPICDTPEDGVNDDSA